MAEKSTRKKKVRKALARNSSSRKVPAGKSKQVSGAKGKKKANSSRKASRSRPLVLVTGAGGFVGKHVVEQALENGFAVRATDLPGSDLSWAKDLGAEIALGDLTNREQVKKLVKGVDRVAHIAAAFNLSLARNELLRINLNGSVNLAEEAASAGVELFVNCSTADTYGVSIQVPTREDAAQNPANDYAFSKLLAEQAVIRVGRRMSMPVSTIRPTVIYGPGAIYTASLFCTIPYILQKRFGFFPRLYGGPLVNAVHVEDVAGSIVFLLGKKNAAGGEKSVYNVADDDWQTMGEYFHNLANPIGVRFSPFEVPVVTTGLVLLTKALERVPVKFFDIATTVLRSEWDRIRTENSLAGALNPRFDKGFLSYGLGDHAYDNTRLKSIGYKFKHPRFAKGYSETIKWYKDHRWIPESAFSV
ncbi:MAG: NAD(P)-dependent oxidoreductase [Deltaproteobacteria bacterium]|nr:NAD(P)-dependent oxidoreductase [Deltaproteobacteria bacterium]